PDWFARDMEHLRGAISIDDNDDWVTALGTWGEFEKLMGYQNGSGKKFQVSTKGRPAEVPYWVQRKRDFTKPPEIRNARAFGGKWRAWWVALQPEWRGTAWPLQRSGGTTSEDWAETAKGGRNGFETILIALTWW
ncbi:hypothetical protein FA95DRAFT_1462598, partial [Auriscalpium vulgare]